MRKSTRKSINVAAIESNVDSRTKLLGETRKSTTRAGIESNAGGGFSTKFSLPSFTKRLEKLTIYQKSAISKVGLGNLLKMPSLTINRILLGELMQRWSCERRAFVLMSKDININLMDVTLILGIRVKGKPVLLKEDEPFSNLEHEYGATLWKRKITIASLESRLDSLGEAATGDFVRSFLLFTFGTFLFPDASGKVDSRYLSVLEDLENVSDYAWGAVVLDDMLTWLCKRKESNVQSVGGCLLFLQIWSYEHIDLARPILLDYNPKYPRACRWGGTVSRKKKWLTSKFTQLHEDQIIWNLTLTSEESDQDIIKELLVAQNERSVHRTPEYSLITNSSLNVSDVNIRFIVVVTESESESTVAIEGDLHQLDESQDLLELPIDRFRNSFSPCPELVKQEFEHLSISQDFCINVFNDNDADLRTRDMTLEEQIMELKKAFDELRLEKQLSRDQLSSSQLSEERLKQENKQYKLSAEKHILLQDQLRLEKQVLRDQLSSSQLSEERLKQENKQYKLSAEKHILLQDQLRLEKQVLRDQLSSRQLSEELLKQENKQYKLSAEKHILLQDQLRLEKQLLEDQLLSNQLFFDKNILKLQNIRKVYLGYNSTAG